MISEPDQRIRARSRPVAERLTTGRAWPLMAALMTGPVITYLVLDRAWRGVAAVAVAALVLAALGGPAAALGLIPLSLLGRTRLTLAAVAVVALVTAVRTVAGFRRLRPAHLWIAALALLLLIAFVFPAVRLTVDHRSADLITLLAGLGLLAAVTAAPPPARGVAAVTALAGGTAACGLLLAGQRLHGRLEGLTLNPNYLGGLLALPLVAAIGLAWRRRRPLWLVPAAPCLAGMVATQSRGAFAAAAVGTAIVVMQGRRRGLQVLVVSVTVLSAVVFPGTIDAAQHAAVGARGAAELTHNTSVREQVAWFAARVAAEHPLRGIGYDMFPAYAGGSPDLGLYLATHNDYLRLAAEAGVLALVAFLALIWLGLRSPSPDGAPDTGDLAVARAMTAAYAVGLLFANQLANLVVSTPFWLALGCLLAAPRRPATPLRNRGEK
jgi:O-antigen ligase